MNHSPSRRPLTSSARPRMALVGAGQWQFQLRDPDRALAARRQLANRRIACG